MTPEQAISQVNEMVFRPGWKFTALTNWTCAPGEIIVVAEVKTWDTSYRAADGTLTKPYTLHPDATIDVSELDRDGLFCAIITQLVRPFDDHEDREFLCGPVPGGRWRAPLHPHTPEGQEAWAKGAADRAIMALASIVTQAA